MNFCKSIVTVRTMLIFLTIGGVYNKLSDNRFITFCLKIYCVTIATILVNSHLFVFFEWAHRTKIPLFLSHFSRIMIFESMWHRMQIICKHFEKEMTMSRMEDGELFKQRLRNCMMIYRRLLNTIQQKNHAMKLLNDKAPLVECLVKVTVSLAPAAFAEMANKEIDKIKLHIAKQMIYCKDQSAQDAIEDAMMFFKHHPFQYTVWRLFTVDGTLILSVVKYLTTYTLAMVQFSHILD
ncbi:hypothetical protein SFRURICE_014687 [Spodoptera frugiperda]|nr:hypothetical protein SFRURICE_014687 [Spodoptera frugiperda]